MTILLRCAGMPPRRSNSPLVKAVRKRPSCSSRSSDYAQFIQNEVDVRTRVRARLSVTASLALSLTPAIVPPAHADVSVTSDVYVATGMGPSDAIPTNTPAVPDPVYTANKEQQVARDTQTVSTYLVSGALAPVPSESSSSLYSPCSGSSDGCNSAPPSYALPISGKVQEQNNWCVPAVAQMILSSMQVPVPTQTQLAKEMGTSKDPKLGTMGANVPESLNLRQGRNKYVALPAFAGEQDVVARTVTDTYRARSTYLLGIDMATAGFYPAGWEGEHGVNTYGYYTQGGGGIYIWDVDDEHRFGQTQTRVGKHPMTSHIAYVSEEAARKKDGGGLVW